MEGFAPKLMAADLSANYVEAGDTLYVTLRWLNAGDAPYTGSGKIAVDFLFDRSQRHLENQPDGFRITWTPFPEFHEWRPGETLSTTGTWTVPKTWCGPFWLHVSLIGAEGESLPFIGRRGTPVYLEELTDIDMGWGWGHVKLVEQRRPVHVELYPEPEPAPLPDPVPNPLRLGGWLLDPRYPAVVGEEGAFWESCPPVVTVRNRETGERLRCLGGDLVPSFAPGTLKGNRLTYAFSGFWGRGTVAFAYENGVLSLSVERVEERAPYELISVYFSRLVSVGEQGTLVNFFCGGRLVEVSAALPMGAAFPYDVCNALAGYEGDRGCALVADDMESVLYQAVEQKGGTRRGVLGAELLLKVPAVSPQVDSIPVEPVPIRLHRLEEPSWQGFARLMRSRLPEGKKGLYHNTLFYKISADKTFEIDENRPETWSQPLNFGAIKELLEKLYHITGGMRQVVYLVGWQRDGHDTEYPFPYRYPFSPKLGTAEEWEDCRQFAKEHNIILSFHDNFDDVYQFEGLDPGWLCTDSRGRLQKGWLWAGGMSYILSPKAYVLSGEMEHRVKQTLEKYHIEDSYHLDVLTSEVRRHDFAPAPRSGARENVEYKKKIVEAFNRYGVDVTSESLAMPFIGSIGYALHTRYNFDERLFSSEMVIPLTTMMVHGSIPYNMGAVGSLSRLRATAYGASCGLDCVGADLGKDHIRALYLHAMPMQLLADKTVSGCVCEPDHIRMQYGEGSYVEVVFSKQSCRIVVDGHTVVQDQLALFPAPTDSDSLLAFSAADRTVEVELSGWETAWVTPLSFEGNGEGRKCPVERGKLTLKLAEDVPVRISRTETF